jgi:putative polyketide hydroxylase
VIPARRLVTDADRGMFLIQYAPSQGESAQDYTAERCKELIEKGIGIAHWQPMQLVAEHFQQGRVSLVGDAAHTMPPKLGLGVNTAMQSAQNLAWKLAAVIRGKASQELLSTYQTERHPVGRLASEQSLVGPAASLLTQDSDDQLLPAEKRVPLFSLIAGYRYRSQALLSEDAVPSSPEGIELLDQPEELTGLPATRV